MDNKDGTSRGSTRRNQNVAEIDQKRRSLATIGLTVPVLMTLASRPALAKQCSPSAMASGNLSDPVDKSTCGTCTHQQWLNANQTDFADCGPLFADPANTQLNQVFNIPNINILLGLGFEPIISGNLLQALQAGCAISSQLKFVNGQQALISPQSAGQATLSQLMCYALTVVLNGSNPITSMTVTYITADVITEVNKVLVLGQGNTIDANQLAAMEQSCFLLMGNGSSCALT